MKSVIVLCTTNCPWDLDEAMRRRLEKRIYIPLPNAQARIDLFKINLKDIPVEDTLIGNQESYSEHMALLGDLTEGYSGADIHLVCREASMMPMRRILADNSPAELQMKRRNGSILIPQAT
jgi:katanin p60 ATPase-containing subunit A1